MEIKELKIQLKKKENRAKLVFKNRVEYPDRIVEKMLLDKEGNVALSIGPFAGDCFDMKSLKKMQSGASGL